MRTLHEIIAMVGDSRRRSTLDYFRQAEGHPLAVVEEIIYGGHAYNFFRSIEAGKIELSTSEIATIRFRRPGVAIECQCPEVSSSCSSSEIWTGSISR